MASQLPSIALFGAGRVGMNLLRHCARNGVPVQTVVERDVSKHDRIRDIHPHAALSSSLPERVPATVRYCILALPDQSLAETADQLRNETALEPDLVVFHCSGTLTSTILSPLASKVTRIGSIHPMQSFPDDDLPAAALAGIGCGIEGDDAFTEEAERFAEIMQWRPLRIEAGKKALYHAANVFAGNFPTVLASLAETLLRASAAADSPERLTHLLPMMKSVVDRVAGTEPVRALTGPAARGDHDAIRQHLEALGALDPPLRDVYEALTRAAMNLK